MSAVRVAIVLTVLVVSMAAAQDWTQILVTGVAEGQRHLSADERRLHDAATLTADEVNRLLAAADGHFRARRFRTARTLFERATLGLRDELGDAYWDNERAALAEYHRAKAADADEAADPAFARARRIADLKLFKIEWKSLDAIDASLAASLRTVYAAAAGMPLPPALRDDAYARCRALRRRALELAGRAPEVRRWSAFMVDEAVDRPCDE